MEFIAHINNCGEIQSVEEHCVNVANRAKDSLRRNNLSSTGYLCGILHDLGKMHPKFTNYIEKSANGEAVQKGSVIHTFAAVKCILEKYHTSFNRQNQNDDSPYRDLVAEIIAVVATSHHGLVDCYNAAGRSEFKYRLEKQPEYDSDACVNFNNSKLIKNEDLDILFGEACKELRTVFEKITEIPNDEEKYNDEVCFYLGFVVRFLISALIDADRTDTAEFMEKRKHTSTVLDYDKFIENLNIYMSNFKSDTPLNKARTELSSICKKKASLKDKIFRLNMPTGSGKTLSSLRFALNYAKNNDKKRIIFVAPLLSIIDQNAQIIRRAINDNDSILEHHSNVVKDRCSDEFDEMELLMQNWDAPIIITTLVQFLNVLFSGQTSAIRRLHSLSNSVVVIDEVQSIPNNLLSLFNLVVNILSEVFDVAFVFSSATQPEFSSVEHSMIDKTVDIIEPNILKEYDNVFKRTTIKYKGEKQKSEIIDFALKKLNEVNSLLIVCNTKAEAAELFDEISCEFRDCYHLSASMCPRHRLDIIETINNRLKNGKRTVCISTQVIEAGIDISFDCVFRIIIGLDSVIQAAGRCNRNGEFGTASDVYVIGMRGEKLHNLTTIKTAQDAMYELVCDETKEDLNSPETIKAYYKILYKKFASRETEFPIRTNSINTTIFKLLSDNEDFSKNEYSINQAFKLAGSLFSVFGEFQDSIVVPYGEGEKIISELCSAKASADINYKIELVNKAKLYLISVFDTTLTELIKSNAIYEICNGSIKVLKKEFYSEKLGLNLKMKGDSTCNILIL